MFSINLVSTYLGRYVTAKRLSGQWSVLCVQRDQIGRFLKALGEKFS